MKNVRVHIILHMLKVSSGHLLSIETFYSIHFIVFVDSEGPDQTAHLRSLIRAFAVCMCPKTSLHMAQSIWSFQRLNCIIVCFYCKKKKKERPFSMWKNAK